MGRIKCNRRNGRSSSIGNENRIDRAPPVDSIDLNIESKSLEEKCTDLRARIDTLSDENNTLKLMVAALTKEVKALRGDNDDYQGVIPTPNASSLINREGTPDAFARIIGPPQRPTAHASRSNQVVMDIPSSVSILTDVDVLSAGLSYSGFDVKRQKRVCLDQNIKRFKSFFGAPPTTLVPMMQDLKSNTPTIIYKHCLMALNWLYSYDTREVLSGRWGRCENDIGRLVIQYAKMIQKLKDKKIRFEFNPEGEYLASYDCVNFLVQEFRLDPSAKYFDHKSHSSGLKYQFMLALEEPRIVHASGPFVPSTADITAFRGGKVEDGKQNWDKDSLYFKLPKGKMVLADGGLAGEPTKITTKSPEHPKEMREWIAKALARQETMHALLKNFNILGHRFRHGTSTKNKMELHKMAVEAVCVIIQYGYENGHPPFDL